MESENKVCMLCLNACDTFETITEATIKTLNKLHFEIDLYKTGHTVMCGTCSEAIQNWLKFKSSLQLLHLDEACRNETNSVLFENSFCGLCMKIDAPADFFVSLITEEKRVTSVKIVLLKYFPELDINRTKNPLICTSCFENLDAYSTFLTTRLALENKVKKHYEDDGINRIEHVELCSVLDNKFSFLNRIKSEEIYSIVKGSTCEDASININETLESDDKKVNIKREVDSEVQHDNVSSTQIYSDYSFEKEIDERTSSEVTIKCDDCEYRAKFRSGLRRHTLIHKDNSEVPMYRCVECGFETKRKHYLIQHSKLHKSKDEVVMYKCYHCDYEARNKYNLSRHVATHRCKSDAIRWRRRMQFRNKKEAASKQEGLEQPHSAQLQMYRMRIRDKMRTQSKASSDL